MIKVKSFLWQFQGALCVWNYDWWYFIFLALGETRVKLFVSCAGFLEQLFNSPSHACCLLRALDRAVCASKRKASRDKEKLENVSWLTEELRGRFASAHQNKLLLIHSANCRKTSSVWCFEAAFVGHFRVTGPRCILIKVTDPSRRKRCNKYSKLGFNHLCSSRSVCKTY